MVKKKSYADADDDVSVSTELFEEEFCTKGVYDDDGVQVSASIGKDGREYGDPTPLEPPVNYQAPPTLMEMMRRMIQSEEFQRRAAESGWDTMDEAGDFEVDDEGDFMDLETAYEVLGRAMKGPPADEPPAPKPGPQSPAEGAGGEAAGSPNKPAPAAPADKPDSTST